MFQRKAAKIRLFAMHTSSLSTFPQRRLVWLLWVALLLPVAQAAAAWHAMSHTGIEANGDADGKRALHPSACDLCLSAAALSGGALPTVPPSLLPPVFRHAVPQSALRSVWLALLAPAYLSRAPPASTH